MARWGSRAAEVRWTALGSVMPPVSAMEAGSLRDSHWQAANCPAFIGADH
jgi:hypothetical protein